MNLSLSNWFGIINFSQGQFRVTYQINALPSSHKQINPYKKEEELLSELTSIACANEPF